MDNNLFSQITDLTSEFLLDVVDSKIKSEQSSHLVNKNTALSRGGSSITSSEYLIEFVGAEKKAERDSIFSYVEYKIALSRQEDGAKFLVMKRYRDLKTFYNEMLNNGHIRDSTGLNFPGSNANNTEDWFTGEAHNPQGAFVTSRKKLLEAFYQKLSKQNPSFFRHERTKTFFQLVSSTGEGGALSSPPPFNLRDKYKLHLEEENYTAKYYIGDSEKSRKTEREIPRATWEV